MADSNSEVLLPPDAPSRTRTQGGGKMGGTKAVVIFCFILTAFVVQSQMAQYVQATLGYRQPYFIFWIAHCGFILILPTHLLWLTWSTGIPANRYIASLRTTVINHLGDPNTRDFPYRRFIWLVLGLTFGSTATAILWYVSVVFAPISDVTALFNTNAFWAYVLTVLMAEGAGQRRWEPRKLFAVLAACGGVFAVVYGGSKAAEDNTPSSEEVNTLTSSAALTIFGEILALSGSICSALYQVLYKKYAAHSTADDPHQPPTPTPPSEGVYQPLLTSETDTEATAPPSAPYTPVLKTPFGLHPNFLTSGIGVVTLLFLWIPIPLMHWTGIGPPFEFPPQNVIWAYIATIGMSGVVFNAGFMILLGIWGPVVVSVGNLLTIVLVLISDSIFGNGANTIAIWGLLGCGMIVGGFAILAIDMLRAN